MISNLPKSSSICTMSQSILPSPNRKKQSKNPSDSSSNGNDKLKKVSSPSSYNVDIIEEKLINTVNDSPEKSRVSETARLIGQFNKSDETTCNLSFGRKLWSNAQMPVHCAAAVHTPTTDIIEEECTLISTLTKQLYAAETQIQKIQSVLTRAEHRLRVKDQEIGTLKRKVKDWEVKTKNQETLRKKEREQRKNQADNSEYLYRRCLLLEHRIFEMEKFLADYGLLWVGDSVSSKQHPETNVNNYIETCYEQLRTNIDQLNLAAGKGEVYVHHNEKGTGASFKTPTCMALRLFKNGMIVEDGPFRLYSDAAAASFIRDILDGYFPSELQQAHPNGVPFKIEDHRTEMYMGGTVTFPGSGYRLGKLPLANSSNHLPGSWSRRTIRTSAQTKESFFNVEPPYISSGCTHNSLCRPLKPKSSIEVPPVNLTSLRSQIMASHNNICSDTHIQSHINAELGLSTRREKRDLATKTTELDTLSRAKNVGQKEDPRTPSSGRLSHRSADRMSSRMSPSRLECIGNRARPRSRSASLSGNSLQRHSAMGPKGFAENGSVGASRTSTRATGSAASGQTRATKSAGYFRKCAPPILHQINEPSGTYGELRLKVRSLNGGTVYLVHVSADESVAKLYQLLDKAMLRSRLRGYKIVISGYAPRRLEQLEMSLRQSGITRDSVLHLVND